MHNPNMVFRDGICGGNIWVSSFL